MESYFLSGFFDQDPILEPIVLF
uniref:Uncharacterized protein n=1 Tax=Rhizophora mucronata TaxID=61149 RepID=A0A2P2N036_RHIMU